MSRLFAAKVVSQAAWVDHNYDYLTNIYQLIQEMNDASGRRVLDRDRCSFADWCALAYAHSTLYTRREEWMYDDSQQDEADYHGADS